MKITMRCTLCLLCVTLGIITKGGTNGQNHNSSPRHIVVMLRCLLLFKLKGDYILQYVWLQIFRKMKKTNRFIHSVSVSVHPLCASRVLECVGSDHCEGGRRRGEPFDLHTNICTFCVTCKIDLDYSTTIQIIIMMMMIWWSCAGHNNEANAATIFFFHLLFHLLFRLTYEHVYRCLLSLHFWHLTSQHHSNLQLHETVRTSMSAT